MFKISTFLDPNFGPYSFPLQERNDVIKRIKSKLSDDLDTAIASYTQFVADTNYDDALAFWRIHESKWPNLAILAKKYLGVQATSASVERMFSISGHIFSNKRRRTSAKLFELLVFLKLNEHFLTI